MTLQELDTLLDEKHGVITLPLAVVRDSYGKDRLGKHVRMSLSRKLKSMGIVHYPEELSASQDELVRLVRCGSTAHTLIEASHTNGPRADNVIREAATEAVAVLESVRELSDSLHNLLRR